MAGEGIALTDRAAKVTLARWAKKVSDVTKRRLPLIRILSKKGRIKHKKGGGQLRWIPEVHEHEIEQLVDLQEANFNRLNELENAFLPWRGYQVKDVVSWQETLENAGEAAVVKIFMNRSGRMQRNAMRGFAKKIYKDGHTDSREMHGIESFMSTGSQNPGDKYATAPNDTYANLSTAYGAFLTGAVEGENPEYGAWSPKIVSTNRQVNGVNLEWGDYAHEFIRALVLQASHGTMSEDNLDLVTLTKSDYEALLNLLDDKERVTVGSSAYANMSKYGFDVTQYVELDGCAVMWDFAAPSSDAAGNTVRGYGWNCDMLELCLISGGKSKSIFVVMKAYDDYRLAHLIRLATVGNFKFESPRFFGALKDLDAAAS